MSQIFLLIIEILGTIAFSVSGAMTALEKKMDIFGVAILGLTTAVGGGVIRDLILGRTPPYTFENPLYAIIAIVVSVIVFFPSIRKLLFKKPLIFDKVLLFMDSIGLGVFTVIGIKAAELVSNNFNIFLLLFVGMITGIGGGVLRDVLAGNTPYIFVKHFYATASFIGALCSIITWSILGETLSMIIGIAVIVVLRLLAAHFRWSLPKSE